MQIRSDQQQLDYAIYIERAINTTQIGGMSTV